MKHALEDITILDFGQWIAGPVGARLCADLGARVIKLEPLEGEPGRPQHDRLDAFTKTFQQGSAGKQAISVDLKAPEGLAIAHRLIERSDVVLNNFRPGVAERLGVDYTAAKKLNPQVIYAFCPGYGSIGPRREKPGFEPLYSAFAGVHRNSGGEGNPPSRATSFDQFCGLLGANAILMALYCRDITGQGQLVEVAQLAQVLYYTSEAHLDSKGNRLADAMLDSEQTGYGPLNRLYQTQDDWVCVSCWTQEEWEALCKALEVQELLKDSRFQTLAQRLENGGALATLLAERFLSKSTLEWTRVLEDSQVPFEVPMMDGEDQVLFNPEYLESGLVAEYEHPIWGKMRAPGFGVGLSMTPGFNQGPPPLLGQHTREILAELGYTPEQTEALREKGVVTWTEVDRAAREQAGVG